MFATARFLLLASADAGRHMPLQQRTVAVGFGAGGSCRQFASVTNGGSTGASADVRLDLRSDTVTKPTKEMRAAMANAAVGDDVLRDDPTVVKLEEKVATLLGKEAALFCTSGTLTNQLALRVHLQALESCIVDAGSHIFRWETGGVAFHAQATMVAVPRRENGRYMTVDDIQQSIITGNDIHEAQTTLICLENSQSDGTLYPLAELQKVHQYAKEVVGLPMHLDGARLWNASHAQGTPLDTYAQYFDSVSVCFSKGLGAPIGSALVGTTQFIERARRFRKAYGGGWRQAGILAAGALHALEHHFDLLPITHENAKYVEQEMLRFGYRMHHPVETNMLYVETPDPTRLPPLGRFARTLEREHGILIDGNSSNVQRLVTHFQAPKSEISRFIEILERELKSR